MRSVYGIPVLVYIDIFIYIFIYIYACKKHFGPASVHGRQCITCKSVGFLGKRFPGGQTNVSRNKGGEIS